MITPCEAAREMRALAAVQSRDREQQRWLAWHIGVLSRIKDYPSFDEFVQPSSRRAPKKRSWEEIHADAMAWAMRGNQQ